MNEFIQNDETRLAMKLVRQGESFFITGKAGTGKTFLLKKIVAECRARGKSVVVTAPTGVAAKNAEGQTIHSLLRLKPSMFIPNKMRLSYRLDPAQEKIIKKLDVLIIDEISMVRSDLLDKVNLTLQHYKGNKNPFGGIQVLFFGDLFQLPPVVTEEDEELFKSYYDNEFFFSSDVIKKHPIKVLELTTMHRQKEDKTFISILNNIREGHYLDSDRKTLNERWMPGYEPSDSEHAVYLRTLKRKVWGHNKSKLDELSGNEIPFTAYIEGDFPKSLFPTDYELRLKVGAKVMLLRNDNDGRKYVNGTLGVITSILGDEIRVKTEEGKSIVIDRSIWKRYEYHYDEETKKIVPVEVGTFRQFPIMLAWAVTIHKSQGMTFSKAIVDARRSFAPGQVYVALSRCRSLEGLTLTSRISASDIMVNSTVVEFMNNVERYSPLDDNEPEQSIFFFADGNKTITGILSEINGDIEIPEGIEKIAEKAFEDNTNIKSVVFPSSLREIDNHAFWGCKNLQEIKLSEGVVRIGVEAFIGTNLQRVVLPKTLENIDLTPFECKMDVDVLNEHYSSDIDGVLYNDDETSLILFPRRLHKETIEVSDSVTSIDAYAFEENTASEIIIPEDIEELQGNLFYGCQNIRTLVFNSMYPDSIKMDDETFKGFEVENCVLRVPFEALANYKADERFKNFKYITSIEGSRCLMYDDNGTEVIGCDDEDCETIEIPEGVTSIKEEAFENKAQITCVELPDTLTSIGYDAFRGTGLSEVYIPGDVSDIGFTAFTCEMTVSPSNTDYVDYDGILYNFHETELIIYPSDKLEEDFEVPDNVKVIGSYSFEDSKLHSITLPESVSKIGSGVFTGCEELKELTILVEDPSSLDVDEKAFSGFDVQLCRLTVPYGCKGNYSNHDVFGGFINISELEGNEEDTTINIIDKDNDLVTGQQFDTLSGYTRAESKSFACFGGFSCYIVMTSKGFYLKISGEGYYFLSKHVCQYAIGSIWVKDKKGKALSYLVSHTVDGENDTPFGSFRESPLAGTLTYTDLKTKKTFTIDIKTKRKL